MNPRDQYQIGDMVVLKSEGVVTRISGYLWWQEPPDFAPEISMYQLECGVEVGRHHIRRYDEASDGREGNRHE